MPESQAKCGRYHRLVILELRRVKQENYHEFEASVVYIYTGLQASRELAEWTQALASKPDLV